MLDNLSLGLALGDWLPAIVLSPHPRNDPRI